MKKFNNPIIPGFNPDPSVCRVGEDFYLVTSTFEYFPAIPIYHSRDLVNWEKIGHVVTRREQLDLDGIRASKGVYAATIRHNKGRFYVAVTVVDGCGNCIFVTDDIRGEWSQPYVIDAPGIDPSLFFDNDGRAYMTGTQERIVRGRFRGHNDIWLRELDLNTMQLVGESTVLWGGGVEDCRYTEGPHLYKINGYYYLLVAEGGTDYNHAVTMAMAEDIRGPYTPSDRNPIITHRNLGRRASIVNVGHADLIDTADGQWYMVLLASRPYGGYFRNLGRETFLVPFEWDDFWPMIDGGIVRDEFDAPILPEFAVPEKPCRDDFDGELDLDYITLRHPASEFASLTERCGYLRLHPAAPLTELGCVAYIGKRQASFDITSTAELEFAPAADGDEAGLAMVMNDRHHLTLTYEHRNGRNAVALTRVMGGESEVLAEAELSAERITLEIRTVGQAASFYCNGALLADGIDTRFLSPDAAGGFTGVTVGIYVTGQTHADFDSFTLA